MVTPWNDKKKPSLYVYFSLHAHLFAQLSIEFTNKQATVAHHAVDVIATPIVTWHRSAAIDISGVSGVVGEIHAAYWVRVEVVVKVNAVNVVSDVNKT